MADVAYVRREMLPPEAPPARQIGVDPLAAREPLLELAQRDPHRRLRRLPLVWLVAHILPWFAHSVWNAELAHRVPPDHQGHLGRGRRRRLLRGDPRALEAVPLRLLPQRPCTGARRSPSSCCSSRWRRCSSPSCRASSSGSRSIFPGLAYWLLWGGIDLGADRDLRRLRRRLARPSRRRRASARPPRPHRRRRRRHPLVALRSSGPIAGVLAQALPILALHAGAPPSSSAASCCRSPSA